MKTNYEVYSFSNPQEDVARLLDFMGHEWIYRVKEIKMPLTGISYKPDFYVPELQTIIDTYDSNKSIKLYGNIILPQLFQIIKTGVLKEDFSLDSNKYSAWKWQRWSNFEDPTVYEEDFNMKTFLPSLIFISSKKVSYQQFLLYPKSDDVYLLQCNNCQGYVFGSVERYIEYKCPLCGEDFFNKDDLFTPRNSCYPKLEMNDENLGILKPLTGSKKERFLLMKNFVGIHGENSN